MSALKVGRPVYLPYTGQMAVVTLVNPSGGDLRRLLVTTADGRRHGVWEDEVQELHGSSCDCSTCARNRSLKHNAETCDCQLHDRGRGRREHPDHEVPA